MTVYAYYVGKKPITMHERRAGIEIAQKMGRVFHDSDKLYALIFELDAPKADLVILTEDGIGVVELKDYGGEISGTLGGHWKSLKETENAIVHAGQFENPYKQVESYKKKISRLLAQERPIWLADIKISTAVCFTRENVTFDKVDIPDNKRHFSILDIQGMPHWAESLVFGGGKTIHKKQVQKLAQNLFNGERWIELERMLPTTKPYGQVTILNGSSQEKTFVLDRSEIIIGRSSDCNISLSKSYDHVSRLHGTIVKHGDDIYFYDGNQVGTKSKHGVWINDKLVKGKVLLQHGSKLVLGKGGDSDSLSIGTGRSCIIRFEFNHMNTVSDYTALTI